MRKATATLLHVTGSLQSTQHLATHMDDQQRPAYTKLHFSASCCGDICAAELATPSRPLHHYVWRYQSTQPNKLIAAVFALASTVLRC